MKLEHYKDRYWREECAYARTPFTPEEGLSAVHSKCGCAGRHDCDCVSVVNVVHSELWYEHNAKP